MHFHNGILLVLALIAVNAAGVQNPPVNARGANSSQTLKVDVDLVLVNATVTDPLNRLVVGLNQEYFHLWEDKVEQKIEYFSSEEIPLTVGIIFDASGSMKEKLPSARNAAATFLQLGTSEDEYFLIEFSDRPKVARDFTTDTSAIQDQIIFAAAHGTTALYDAVYLGLEKMKKATNPRRALLLITDGEDNRSRYSFANVRDFIKEQDVQLYAIGIVDEHSSQLTNGRTGRRLMEELTEVTGGRAYFPESLDELEDICARIALELKSQYVLGYRSTNDEKDGRWRKLRVRIESPKGLPDLDVRARSGYAADAAGAAATKTSHQ